MRRFAIIAGVAVVLGLPITWFGGPTIDVLTGLVFGWMAFCARVFPKIRIAWDGVATGVLCLILFTVGLHRMLRWFYREIQKAGGETVEGYHPWSARWTISLVVLIVAMFAVGISATGIVHQAGWLIASRRSLVEKKPLFLNDWNSSVNHLKQIGMGSAMLLGDQETSPSEELRLKAVGLQSWMTEILPGTFFIIGGELRQDLPWNNPRNSAYFKGIVPIYLNPEINVVRSPEGYALSHFAGNVHILGHVRAIQSIGRGEMANTILAGEVAEGFKPWGDPTNLRDPGLGVNAIPGGFGGPSGSGANFLFMDGSVRLLRETTDRTVLRRLSLPRPLGRGLPPKPVPSFLP